MSEKFLLSDEELSSVVGGLAGGGDTCGAFDTAVQRLEGLVSGYNLKSDVIKVVNMMIEECYPWSMNPVLTHRAEYVIGQLEGYYSELVSLNYPQTAAQVRNILDELKTSLGL